jgi:inosose dehydratase
MANMPINIAFNPLSWYLTVDGWHPELAPPLSAILKAIRTAGYDGVHSDIPPGMSSVEYSGVLSDAGLLPAPGYFQARFSDPGERTAIVASAACIARDHAALGLDRIFLADQMGVAMPRLANPAQGVEADPRRLARLIDGIAATAEAMIAEGVTPCLHLHVGTWIETVDEADAVLGAIPAKLLMVGPDTGHIAWAGGNPVAFVEKHAGRIGAVHIKDIRRSVAAAVRNEGGDYRNAGARHIWTELGRGDLDLEGVLKALSGFDGWYIIEVDIADQPTVEQSAALSAQWLRPRVSGKA